MGLGIQVLGIGMMLDLDAHVEDSSFKKAQETLHYVATDIVGISKSFFQIFKYCRNRTCMSNPSLRQEIEFQGLGHLRGLSSSLMASGAFGKHPQNIKRDMLRKLSAKDPDSPAPWHVRIILDALSDLHANCHCSYACLLKWQGTDWTCSSPPLGARSRWKLFRGTEDHWTVCELNKSNDWWIKVSSSLFSYLTGQEHASCATTSAISLDDATRHLAYVARWELGTILEASERCGITIEWNEWW